MLLRVLVASRSATVARRLSVLLEHRACLPTVVHTTPEIDRALARDDLDVLIVDREFLEPDVSPALRTVLDDATDRLAVIALGRFDASAHARMLARGVAVGLDTGLPDDVLEAGLAATIERQRRSCLRRIARRDPVKGTLADFATSSPAMRQLVSTASRIAHSDSSVLVLGETGVGKEWLARAIHAASPRAAGPFVAVNCGALPDGLLESELFGHERGAFTGAVRSRRGLFELAHGGTLFLDEVAEMAPHLQVKLLRVLEDRAVRPVGAERQIEVDLRVIAATNRDPGVEITAGRLRLDLFYRLGVLTLMVPPLRQRREDIPVLVDSYGQRFAQRFGRGPLTIEDAALSALERYPWPGNVRELINVVERLVLLGTDSVLRASDLPDEILRGESRTPTRDTSGEPEVERTAATDDDVDFFVARDEVLDRFEREYLIRVLTRSGGRVGEAAARSGLDPRSLYDKMRRHGLRKEDFRFTRSHAAS